MTRKRTGKKARKSRARKTSKGRKTSKARPKARKPRAKFVRVTIKRLDEKQKSIDIAEHARQSVERGAHKYHLGSTGWVPPTRAGLTKARGMIRHLSNRKMGEKDVYSFDFKLTFNDKSGKVVNKTLSNVGIPSMSELKKRYPKLSKHEAFEKWVDRKLRQQIFSAFSDHFPYPITVEGKRLSGAAAQSVINKVRSQRNAKLAFTFYRDTA